MLQRAAINDDGGCQGRKNGTNESGDRFATCPLMVAVKAAVAKANTGKCRLMLKALSSKRMLRAVSYAGEPLIDRRDGQGRTLQHYAAIRRFDRVASLLRAQGCRSDVEDKRGRVARDYQLALVGDLVGDRVIGREDFLRDDCT